MLIRYNIFKFSQFNNVIKLRAKKSNNIWMNAIPTIFTESSQFFCHYFLITFVEIKFYLKKKWMDMIYKYTIIIYSKTSWKFLNKLKILEVKCNNIFRNLEPNNAKNYLKKCNTIYSFYWIKISALTEVDFLNLNIKTNHKNFIQIQSTKF